MLLPNEAFDQQFEANLKLKLAAPLKQAQENYTPQFQSLRSFTNTKYKYILYYFAFFDTRNAGTDQIQN